MITMLLNKIKKEVFFFYTALTTAFQSLSVDDYAFRSALRHLWIQENIAQNNPAKITISEEQLNQAILVKARCRP